MVDIIVHLVGGLRDEKGKVLVEVLVHVEHGVDAEDLLPDGMCPEGGLILRPVGLNRGGDGGELQRTVPAVHCTVGGLLRWTLGADALIKLAEVVQVAVEHAGEEGRSDGVQN